MQYLFDIIFITSLVSQMFICSRAGVDGNTFNVVDYGARGDGESDDSEAFTKVWTDACKATSEPTILIPEGKTFLVYPMFFTGPCNFGAINIKLLGTIQAPESVSAWKGKDVSKWLGFKSITGLHIDGSGFLDGSGKGWWDISCKYHPGEECNKLAPTVLSFDSCNGLRMSNVSVKDSPQTHILVMGSENADLSLLNIQSPGTSPNTDGIHIQSSRNVSVHGATISSGDDCISIGDGTSQINITDIYCGPGHGISIGSLGKDENEVSVESIMVRNAQFKGTTNGVRIKTWQVGRGNVRHIDFSGLNFTDVKNPIIIDQYYCDTHDPESCKAAESGVRISDVVYSNSFGTSASEVAVNFNCSRNVPCENITVDTIKLRAAGQGRGRGRGRGRGIGNVVSSCNNAYGLSRGVQQPKACLQLKS